MALADRDYEPILGGIEKALNALENLKKEAKMLSVEADSARATLQDKVGQKDIQAIQNLAETITNAVKPGEERIRELEHKIKKERDAFESLLGER